jgi:hypothetical protein
MVVTKRFELIPCLDLRHRPRRVVALQREDVVLRQRLDPDAAAALELQAVQLLDLIIDMEALLLQIDRLCGNAVPAARRGQDAPGDVDDPAVLGPDGRGNIVLT